MQRKKLEIHTKPWSSEMGWRDRGEISQDSLGEDEMPRVFLTFLRLAEVNDWLLALQEPPSVPHARLAYTPM